MARYGQVADGLSMHGIPRAVYDGIVASAIPSQFLPIVAPNSEFVRALQWQCVCLNYK